MVQARAEADFVLAGRSFDLTSSFTSNTVKILPNVSFFLGLFAANMHV